MNSHFHLFHRPRSRGKPAVEDEDSMDGLEAAETENTVETGKSAYSSSTSSLSPVPFFHIFLTSTDFYFT